MRNLLLLTFMLVPALVFTACHKHTRIIEAGEDGSSGGDGANGADGADGTNGEDGADGADGSDGIDGLNGLGFDYVRGMDGAEICEGALIIPAQYVVPANILALAPAEDPYDPDGLTLTFGTVDTPIRFYLGTMFAGEYCLVEKVHGEGWVAVGGALVFEEKGFIAIVPPEMVPFVDPAVLQYGRVVDFPAECNVLDYSRHHLKIGRDIRINFNRD